MRSVIALSLAFALELCLFLGSPWVAYDALGGGLGGAIAAAAVFAVSVGFWAALMAPRSPRRLGVQARTHVRLVAYSALAAGLALDGHGLAALALFSAAVIDEALLRRLEPT